MGGNFLQCEEEKDKEYDKHVLVIIYDSFNSNKVEGPIPFYWNESANKFLKFQNHHIRVVVTGKRVNRDNQLIEWFKKSIDKLKTCTNVRMKKMHETTCKICLFTKHF